MKSNVNLTSDRTRTNSAIRHPTKKEGSITPIDRKLKPYNNKLTENVTDFLTTQTATNTFAPNLATTSQGNVNVVCRFRPLNEKEKNFSKDVCVDFINDGKIVLKSQGEYSTHNFSFDRIFNSNESQQTVYEYAAKPIIESVLEGFNGTIFAYGQTSSGKTFTMQGEIDNHEKEGIIPRMIRHVFNFILNSSEDLEYTVKVSMLEIYQEKIRDLVDTDRVNLNVREDKAKGIYVEDLSEHYVASEEEVIEIMKIGSDNRAKGATNMNEHSSRSHSIFVMTIHQNNLKDLSAKTGKLYLVDLAGSEKVSKTGATGLTLEEAKMINKSLTTLGMVINSLTDGKSTHIPYRESKLTRVLQESLGGNAKTCLIITCSPSIYNEAETLSTLRFGMRAKKIKNKPKINKEVTLAELKIEIERLEQIIKQKNHRINQLEAFIKFNNLNAPNEDEKFALKEQKQEEIEINQSFGADEDKKEDDNTSVVYHEERDSVGLNLENYQLQNEMEKQNKLQKEKLEDLTNQLELLEEDRKILNEKLNLAIQNIKDFTAEIEQKENVLEQLQKIQDTLTNNESKMQMRIIELEKALEQNKFKEFKDEATSINLNMDNLESIENEEDEQNKSIRKTLYNTNREHKIQNQSEFSIIKQFVKRLEQTDDKTKEIIEIIDEYKFKLNELFDQYEIEERDMPCKDCENIKENFSNLLESEKTRAENEKKIILKVLEEKSERLSQFENENMDLYDTIKRLENKFNPDEKNYVKKLVMLEKNLDQLNKMLQNAVAQKSILVISKQDVEYKLKEKSEKVTLLENEMNELYDQIKIKDEKVSVFNKISLRPATSVNHMVKRIKGGHLKQNPLILNGDMKIES